MEWFDAEIRGLLGLDVFAEEFSKDEGYQIYTQKNFELLVIRMEDLDRVGRIVVREFLGLPEFNLLRENIGSDKKYAEAYREVKRKIILPNEYLDSCYKSKYFRHFYSGSEADYFREKWGKESAALIAL
jgi:hypothetical protein